MYILIGIFIISVLGLLCGPIISSYIFNHKIKPKIIKENYKKANEEPKYFYELPRKRPPALVSKIFNFYKEESNNIEEFTSTMLDMYYKGSILIKKTNDQIYIKVNKDIIVQECYEKIIFDIIEEAQGDSENITINELKEYIYKERYTIIDKRKEFSNLVNKKFRLEKLYDTFKLFSKFNEKLFWSSIAIYIILSIVLGCLSKAMFLSFVVLGLLYFTIVLNKTIFEEEVNIFNQEGSDEYALWQAFSRYIDTFSNNNELLIYNCNKSKEFIPYAIAMRKSDEVINSIVSICENEDQDSMILAINILKEISKLIFDLYDNRFQNMYIYNDIGL